MDHNNIFRINRRTSSNSSDEQVSLTASQKTKGVHMICTTSMVHRKAQILQLQHITTTLTPSMHVVDEIGMLSEVRHLCGLARIRLGELLY